MPDNTDITIGLLKDIAADEPVNFENVISTGFKVFDDTLLGGVKGGDLVVISGISGHGKTSFAQTLTYNFVKDKVPCLWFSYEVNNAHLQRKFDNMSNSDASLPIYSPIKTTSGGLGWIASKIREARDRYGTKIIFIDHIDYIVPTTIDRSDTEARYIKRIVMESKSLAIELNVVIVLMVHVTKKTGDGEPDAEPKMSDISGSASIYQNADVVFMVYRIPVKNSVLLENSGDLFTNQTRIKTVKNRPTGQSKFILCEMENDQLIQVTDDIASLVV